MRRTLLLAVALSVVAAWPAGAQNLKVEFHDGRVSVDATSVPVRTILTEWGKIGGTKIVGAERITGAPITVKLINVTEAQALETILRSVAGLHGRAAQHRSRRVDVRPHHGDGDDSALRRLSRPTPRPARSNQTPPSTARSVSFRRASGPNRPNPTSRKSRMKIRRTRRSSRSRSRARAAS